MFWTLWEILLNQSHSRANWLPLAFFEKILFFRKKKIFSKKSPYILFSSTKYWKILRFLTFSVALYCKNCYLQQFLKKKHMFFSKITYVLFNKTKFWTFWGVLLIQSHFAANLLLLAIMKKFKKFFLESPSIFSSKNS